jgi:NAD(P)-dependent dehydrogenase (short-subunit alcohol dehydrogenase family)
MCGHFCLAIGVKVTTHRAGVEILRELAAFVSLGRLRLPNDIAAAAAFLASDDAGYITGHV